MTSLARKNLNHDRVRLRDPQRNRVFASLDTGAIWPVMVEELYEDKLGVTAIGETFEVNGHRASGGLHAWNPLVHDLALHLRLVQKRAQLLESA
jgi:hypothetical protein